MFFRRAVLSAGLYALALAATAALATPASAANGDIVLNASDVTAIAGNWSVAGSDDAASGITMTSVPYGWSSWDTALANPADYFEASFTAPANVPYHVWLRLRAAGNSKWSDSVWVQFSDALDQGGSAGTSDRFRQRAARQPGELQGLRTFGMGLAGQGLLAAAGECRSIFDRWNASNPGPDPRGRRSGRSDRAERGNLHVLGAWLGRQRLLRFSPPPVTRVRPRAQRSSRPLSRISQSRNRPRFQQRPQRSIRRARRSRS